MLSKLAMTIIPSKLYVLSRHALRVSSEIYHQSLAISRLKLELWRENLIRALELCRAA
jgi:hypothetical protein